jgi:dienelactone hydrolase
LPQRAEAQAAPFATLAPSGPFGAGRVERTVVGVAPALIYYPSLHQQSAPVRASPMGAAHRANLTRRFGASAADALFDGMGYSALRAPMVRGRHPLLVFAPGARLTAYDYRTLLEELASRGFVIVAITPLDDANYAAVAALIRTTVNVALGWSVDAEDALGVGIDARNVGVFGHSLGGAAGVWAAAQDARVRAVLNFDGDFIGGAEQARPHQALLYATCADLREPAASQARRTRVWDAVSAQAEAQRVELTGMRHFNFLDAALLTRSIPPEQAQGRFGPIDGARGLAIAGALAGAFFDERLMRNAGAVGRALAALPEVTPG